MLDVSQSDSEAELRGTGKLPPLIAARLYWLILIPIAQAMVYKSIKSGWATINVWFEVNDIHGHNIGVVGQGSQLLFAPMKYRHRLMWQLISNKGFMHNHLR